MLFWNMASYFIPLPASPFSSDWFQLNCCFSIPQSCLTLCDPRTAAHQVSLSFTISQSLLKLMCIESVIPSDRLILCEPLFLMPSAFPSLRVFSSESALHIRWPKYWSFSFSISPSNEYSQRKGFTGKCQQHWALLRDWKRMKIFHK